MKWSRKEKVILCGIFFLSHSANDDFPCTLILSPFLSFTPLKTMKGTFWTEKTDGLEEAWRRPSTVHQAGSTNPEQSRGGTAAWLYQPLLLLIHTSIYVTPAPDTWLSAAHVMSRCEPLTEVKRFPAAKADKHQENKLIVPIAFNLQLLGIPLLGLLGSFIKVSSTTSKKCTTNIELSCINKGCQNSTTTEAAADFAIQLPPST